MWLLLKSQEDRALSSIPFSRDNSAVAKLIFEQDFWKNYSVVLSHKGKYLCLKRRGKASGLEHRIGNLKTRLVISFCLLFFQALPQKASTYFIPWSPRPWQCPSTAL